MSFINEPGRLQTAPKGEPKVINYAGGVTKLTGDKGGIFENQNTVASFQKIYQAGHDPIHLKTPRDRLMYKGLMYGSLLGVAASMYGLYFLAKPKRNN